MAVKSKFIRIAEVVKMTSLSKSTIYRWQKSGSFPVSTKLSGKIVGWVEADIKKWLKATRESI